MSGLITTVNKSARTLVGQTSNGAGAQTVGDGVNLTTAMGMVITGQVTNGPTAPNVGCDFVVQISHDGANWRDWTRQHAGTADDQTYTFAVELPPAVMHTRVLFEGNTGEAVTVEALGHELTSLGTS